VTEVADSSTLEGVATPGVAVDEGAAGMTIDAVVSNEKAANEFVRADVEEVEIGRAHV
jgi:hypothetical protein